MGRQRRFNSFLAYRTGVRITRLAVMGVLACATAAGCVVAINEAAARQASGQRNAVQPASRGEVFLNGRWVSSAWCDATLPGPDGGPGGPGRSLCDASTPRR